MSGLVLRTLHNHLSFDNHNNAIRWVTHFIDEETEDQVKLTVKVKQS